MREFPHRRYQRCLSDFIEILKIYLSLVDERKKALRICPTRGTLTKSTYNGTVTTNKCSDLQFRMEIIKENMCRIIRKLRPAKKHRRQTPLSKANKLKRQNWAKKLTFPK